MPRQILKDRYSITQSVLNGRLAEVSAGVDLDTGRKVAIKLFHRALPEADVTREAFERESQRLMTLKHPNIIAMLDYGSEGPDGRPFLILEWGGEPIDKWLNGGCPYRDWNDFYEKIGRQLLEGIAYAHFRETAHRELKPSDFLVDERGHFRLADFGVSKYPEFIDAALDIGSFLQKHEPFSPSTGYDPAYSYTTDVWGYATVCLYVLTKGTLAKWDQIPNALGSLAAPKEVRDVLHDALSPVAAERPLDAQVLLSRLDEVMQRSRPARQRDTCFLGLTEYAFNKLRQIVPRLKERRDAELFIENELAGGTSFARLKNFDFTTRVESIVPDQYVLLGESMKLVVKVDEETQASLAIVSVVKPVSDGAFERERNNGWATELNFKMGRPYSRPEGMALVDSLLRGLDFHDERQLERRRQDEEEKLFRSWSNMLQLRMDHCREGKAYAFRGVELEGNRITFNLTETPDQNILEETWMIENRQIWGVVDRVTEDSITLYIDEAETRNLPASGRLVIDRRATQKQLRVQLEALNFMRHPRTARQELLKQRILYPADAETDSSCAPIAQWFSAELDDNKKTVIQAALAAKDIFQAEGPPGTGKTTFIAELILQHLNRWPQKRILLTSQTHIAVDNAIERVSKHRPDLRITRVGRQEFKVADTVRRYLLENRLEEWRKRVYQQAAAFLKHRAEQEKLDVKKLQMGLDASLLVNAQRSVQHEEESERERLAELITIGQQLDAKDDQQNPLADADTTLSLQGEKDRLIDDLGQTRRNLKERLEIQRQLRANFQKDYPDYAEMALWPVEEIVEWQDSLIGSSPAANRFQALFELNAEWIQRFALREDCEEAILLDSDLIAGTCIGIAASDSDDETYGLCILDEASKASFPEALVPLIRSEKWILVGDQRQLPPFEDLVVANSQLLDAREIDTATVRETMLTRFSQGGIPAHARAMLYRQHRMVPAIGDLISRIFYEGRLESVGERKAPTAISNWLPKPVAWYSTSKQADRGEHRLPNGSWMNPLEARWIRQMLGRLEFYAGAYAGKHADPAAERLRVVVLTGYAAQRSHLETVMEAEQCPHLDIEYHTVDAYQGREADVVFFSITRSNLQGRAGFLEKRERINVALSRARYALCLVGDADYCRGLGGLTALADVRAYIERTPDACLLKEGLT